MASNSEIAKELLVAALNGSTGTAAGQWVGEQYKAILEAVSEANKAERLREIEMNAEIARKIG